MREVDSPRRPRSIPFVQQLSATECGAACLAMVLRYFGKHVPVDVLRDATVSGRDATNAQLLIDAGRTYGLRGRAVALDLDQLEYLERGAILHWAFNHFVVFDRVTREGVHVVDPRRGHVRISLADFSRGFTGVAILFEPAEDFRRGGNPHRPIRRYVKEILSESGFLTHVLASSLLLQLVGLALPLITRVLVDGVIPRQDYHLLWLISIGMAMLIGFQAWTSTVRSYLLLYLRARLDARMTLGFIDYLLTLPLGFFQRRSTGDLLTRVQSNATVREILTGTMLSTVLDGFLATGYLALLLAISPPLALLTIVLSSIQILVFFFTRDRQRELIAEGLDAQAKSHGYLVEVLSAVETLKALGAERRGADRWASLFASELNVSLRRGKLDAWLQALTGVLRVGSSLVLLGVGASLVMSGSVSLGDMLALTAIAAGFIGPLLNLAAAGTQLQLLQVYLERLDDVLQTEPEVGPSGSPIGLLRGAISLRGISFRYGPASPLVVRDVSIEVRPGEFVAIVGPSGSGKSTLLRMMVGLYPPAHGSVYYDGIDLAHVDIATLRRQVGVVTQQAPLFSGTIRSNIALSDPSLPLERVVAAAKAAGIHDDVSRMPLGYETPLMDRGSSLSGGQQQRIAIARALVSDPRVLALDEATSQLDALTEEAVQRALASRESTRLVVAHRLSTIRTADRILVMSEGSIVEEGTHSELLERAGVYKALVSAQLGPPGPDGRH